MMTAIEFTIEDRKLLLWAVQVAMKAVENNPSMESSSAGAMVARLFELEQRLNTNT